MSYNFDRIIRITEPSVEPITLAEAKAQLRFDGTEEDDYITTLISVARDKVEGFCNRYWAKATCTLLFDNFPSGIIPFDLYRPDIISIDSVTYLDTDNETQTVTGSTLDSDRRIMLNATAWPTDAISVKVNVTMGPDTTASPQELPPKTIHQAMLLVITDLYNNRASLTTLQTYKNEAVEYLAYPYRTNLGI